MAPAERAECGGIGVLKRGNSFLVPVYLSEDDARALRGLASHLGVSPVAGARYLLRLNLRSILPELGIAPRSAGRSTVCCSASAVVRARLEAAAAVAAARAMRAAYLEASRGEGKGEDGDEAAA